MRQQIEAALQELHTQLESLSDLEDREVQELRNSVDKLQATLDKTDVNSASLAEMLQQSVERFSDTHPIVVQTVGRIAEMLAQMGI